MTKDYDLKKHVDEDDFFYDQDYDEQQIYNYHYDQFIDKHVDEQLEKMVKILDNYYQQMEKLRAKEINFIENNQNYQNQT